MTPIKLIATDMDGTLLDGNGNVPVDFAPWVVAHPDITTAIASGRQMQTLQQQFAAVADRLTFISDNGALVVHRGEVLQVVKMDPMDVDVVLEVFAAIPGAVPLVCGLKTAYVSAAISASCRAQLEQYYLSLCYVDDPREAAQHDTVIKVAVYFSEGPAPQDEPWRGAIPAGLKALITSAYWCDVASDQVNKGQAIRAIQRKLGISRDQSMAFGDYLNDIDLLQACEESYCMANGVDAVKAIAKHMAPACTEDGVMQVLRQLDNA